MVFDWMNATPAARPARTAEAREQEIVAHAFVLAKLGYPKKRIEARLRQNLAWEYEGVGSPRVQKKLGALVSEACRRAGLAASVKRR